MGTSSLGKTIGPEGATYEILDVNGVAQVQIDGAVQAAVTQQPAITDPTGITGFTPSGSGAVTVTSNAATDLDTTQAALDQLIIEVTNLRLRVVTLLSELRDAGVIAT